MNDAKQVYEKKIAEILANLSYNIEKRIILHI